jgi:hypothetical protein
MDAHPESAAAISIMKTTVLLCTVTLAHLQLQNVAVFSSSAPYLASAVDLPKVNYDHSLLSMQYLMKLQVR